MNTRTRTLAMLVAVVSTLCLFPLERSASGQSPRGLFGPGGNSAQSTPAQSANNCMKVKGTLADVSTPSGVIGTLRNGGILNGTYELLNHGGPLSTPDPNSISYTVDWVLTTNQGQLKTNDVGVFDFVTGVFSEIQRIDSAAGTGIFAGATGVLYTNGKTTDGGATFQSKITGEICFAP